MRRAKPQGFRWLLGASCAVLTGCAYSYVDERGSRHVLGLVHIELAAPDRDPTFAGHVVDLSTFGISLNGNPSGNSFTIGYSREVTGYLRNHALALGDPLGIRSAGGRVGTEP